MRLLFVVFAAAVAGMSAYPGQAQDLPDYVIEEFGAPPPIPDGPLAPAVAEAVEATFVDSAIQGVWGPEQIDGLNVIADSGDPRLAWLITDLMRFVTNRALSDDLSFAATKLLNVHPTGNDHWDVITNHLIAWDVPEPPDYLRVKRTIFTTIIPGWDHIFVEGDIDWRLVSWGGVLIDDRPFGTEELCNCIPAVDNPEVSSANDATWLKDSDIVFGIEVGGEARAYPRRIMEVREMVNDTLGGRDLGIPYCTLCGAAQAYFTDAVPGQYERPVLRTSGLLIRSNKVMYDSVTWSVFDTFLGKAVTGPLAEIGVELEQAPVITTTWGEWKAAHPQTTVLVEHLALGRDFDFRNGRDADGPIFPVGDVDPRLPVHEDVVGVVTASGTPVAFPRGAALVALRAGEDVAFENARLVLDAGGIKAIDTDGNDLGSHQAFWFAWSQFHPETKLWPFR